MKFTELSKEQQNKTFTEIVKEFMENGENFPNAIKCAKEYINDIDGNFRLVDYSPDEDETDLRVEW